MAEINKTIYLHGEFGVDILSDVVIPQIDQAIADKVSVITFDISSFGGSVKTGREIMGAAERAKLAGIKIATQCLSFAYSMGANCFVMGTKGMRKISEHAEIMFHAPMGKAEGNADEMARTVQSLREMSDNLLGYITKGNDANAAAIKQAFDNAEMIGADKAIALGLADGYVEKMQAVAYYDNKTIDMKKENIEEAKSLLQIIRDGVKSIFAKDVVNASVKAGDTTMYYDGNLDVNTKVFSDEAMQNPTPDGVYGDYTVSGGVITAIAPEPTDAEKKLAEAQAKLAELEAKLSDEQKEKDRLKSEIDANKAAFDLMATNVAKLENIVIGEEGRHRENADDTEVDESPKAKALKPMLELLNKANKLKATN